MTDLAPKVQPILLPADGIPSPTTPDLPLLLYPGAFLPLGPDPAAGIEALFDANNVARRLAQFRLRLPALPRPCPRSSRCLLAARRRSSSAVPQRPRPRRHRRRRRTAARRHRPQSASTPPPTSPLSVPTHPASNPTCATAIARANARRRTNRSPRVPHPRHRPRPRLEDSGVLTHWHRT